jgi:hypothetical protein
MVVVIAAMTLVRTLRWNELGLLGSLTIVAWWIAVADGANAIEVTFWNHVGARVEAKRAGRPGRV